MIKVMIIDDSSVVRQVIQELLQHCHDIEVIATASDPIFAMGKMRNGWPDVIVLDIEMPRMDGITFLRQIMSVRPTPVIICSTLTEKNASITMEALAAGAVSIITKPSLGLRDFLNDSFNDLLAAIRAAAQARPGRVASGVAAHPELAYASASAANAVNLVTPTSAPTSALAPAPISAPPRRSADIVPFIQAQKRLNADVILAAPDMSEVLPATDRIVAIGASTGGPQALEQVLCALRHCPGMVVVQHMPEHFTRSFAERLNGLAHVQVKEAEHLDLVIPDRVLIAPGGKHMMLRRDGAQYYVEVINGPLVSRHKPSVDVLFRSVAKAAGPNAVGIIMTGMGDDGARGLREMAQRGAMTYAQDERSCIVFGMPREAIELGGVGEVVALDNLSSVIERHGN